MAAKSNEGSNEGFCSYQGGGRPLSANLGSIASDVETDASPLTPQDSISGCLISETNADDAESSAQSDLIFCNPNDRDAAEEFSEFLNGIAVEIRLMKTVVFDATPGEPSFHSLGAALEKSRYVFLFLTRSFCEDFENIFQTHVCLKNMIDKKSWRVIPVYTEEKRDYNIPVPLSTISGIETYVSDEVLKKRLNILFRSQLPVDPSDTPGTRAEKNTSSTVKFVSEGRQQQLKHDRTKAFQYASLTSNIRSLFIDTEGIEKPVWKSRVESSIAQSICQIYGPRNETGTGFRVGSCYVLTAGHVVRDLTSNLGNTMPQYYAIFDNLHPADRTDDKKFLFRELVFSDPKLDAAILKLAPHSSTHSSTPIPEPLIYFCEPVYTGSFFFIGHSKGAVMSSNDVNKLFPLNEHNIQHLRDLDIKSRELGYGSYDDTENLTDVLDPNRYLFQCVFTRGGSGSPGLVMIDRDPVVTTMLLRGYPPWYYEVENPNWQPQDCVEQGLNMKSLYENLLRDNPTVCEDIFGKAKYMQVSFPSVSDRFALLRI